jgi:rRNA maturation endonuclease Nob1
MKDFQIYVCHNDHTNYVEVGKNRHECKICGAALSIIYGVTLRAESEDELSRESEYDSNSESFLSSGTTRG